jgi:hypothetical protein
MSNNLSLTPQGETTSFMMNTDINGQDSNIIPSLYTDIPALLIPPIIDYVSETLLTTPVLSSVNENFANPFEVYGNVEYTNAISYAPTTTSEAYDEIPDFSTIESMDVNTIFVSTIERLRHEALAVHNQRIMNDFFDSIREDEEMDEEIIRHVIRESFDEEQQKRRIDETRELAIHVCGYDKDITELSKYNTCRICFEDYTDNVEIGILPCKHFFHQECIQEWGKRKPVCPYCDIEIPIVSNESSCKKQKTN